MEPERLRAPGPGCERPSPRAASRDPAVAPAPHPRALRAEAPWPCAEGPGPRSAPVTVPAPPQGPPVGGSFAGLEFALPQEPEPGAADLRAPGTWARVAARLPTPSVHIPVPAQRATPGKARLEEVMAAAALTSLSTSPLLLGATAAASSPEPGLEPWKGVSVQPPGSYSSSHSGDWGWELGSDQSSLSTPSPPLPPEAAHFLFGEPTVRKRKSSVQVLFQCLWKSCGKVLRSASAMQRHIRLAHLGRQAEPEQSDGEEDFYYTEVDVGVDALTDGLSGLSAMSPTTCMPPTSPRLELPGLLEGPALPSTLSSVGSSQTWHSDHACQVCGPTGSSWGLVLGPSGGDQSPGCVSPQGCLHPSHLESQPAEVRACAPALSPKLGASLRCACVGGLGQVQTNSAPCPHVPPRRPRGDAKKCRKVYGMDHRALWCTACRWKKACQRFLD